MITFYPSSTPSNNDVLKYNVYAGKWENGQLVSSDAYRLVDEDTSTSRFDCGLALGADVEYHRFVVGAEFEYGFIPMAKNDFLNQKIRNISAYVIVGYKF